MPQLPHSPALPRADEDTVRGLAQLRYGLHRFLRSVENGERQYGITPRQMQLLLGVAGFTGMGRASVSELADFLQEKHNSVVGLIDRAQHSGLVRRETASSDRRVVLISLTPRGLKTLAGLVPSQWEQARRLDEELARLEEGQKARRDEHEHASRAGAEERISIWSDWEQG
jgi:DNA-binding MarR family transcriptional regulator